MTPAWHRETFQTLDVLSMGRIAPINKRNLLVAGLFGVLAFSAAPITAQPATAPEPAVGTSAELVSFNYMLVFRRAAQLGLLSQDIDYTVTVAPDGTARDCDLAQEFRSPFTSKELCRAIIRSAEFAPARDEAGQATSATFAGTIRYWSPFAASR